MIHERELKFIAEAAQFLDSPNLVMKMTALLGKPIDMLQNQLPEKAQVYLTKTVEKSLHTALKVAIATIDTEPNPASNGGIAEHRAKVSGWAHTAGVAATGAFGGFFGLAALPVELPVSTAVIMRGISNAATEWGQDLKDPEVQLQCLYVFTLGTAVQGALETSVYLTSRVAFSKVIRDAAAFVGQYSARELFLAMERGAASVFTRFIAQVAARFEVAVTDKLIASAIPIAGAVGGAAINAAFCDYYVTAARFHFGLLHLEKLHGTAAVQKAFRQAPRVAAR